MKPSHARVLIVDLVLDNLLGIIERDIFITIDLSNTDNKPVAFRLDNDINGGSQQRCE